jgi:tRNA A-37 threonylcarbamoyl transferase component Bud32
MDIVSTTTPPTTPDSTLELERQVQDLIKRVQAMGFSAEQVLEGVQHGVTVEEVVTWIVTHPQQPVPAPPEPVPAPTSPVQQRLQELGLHEWEVPYTSITETGTKLGHGSFGDVMKVTWRGMEMAFKTMRGGSKGANEQLKAALKEARYLRELKHENVIGLFGICTDANHMGLLMEFAEQGTLRDVLDTQPEMTVKVRQKMIKGMLAGVVRLHSKQPSPIVHGDIKSANMLVMADGTCKISDFGMTSGAASGLGVSKTHRGGGTPVYAAPELFEHMFQVTG